MNRKATAAIVLATVLLVSAAGIWVALTSETITGNAVMPKRAMTCTSNTACNDFNGCTQDLCIYGSCTNPPANCIPCMTDRKCWNGACIGESVIPPGACGSYYDQNTDRSYLTSKPNKLPTPRPDCEHMKRITAVSGWIMKTCTFQYNPADGTYGFAVTFGF